MNLKYHKKSFVLTFRRQDTIQTIIKETDRERTDWSVSSIGNA